MKVTWTEPLHLPDPDDYPLPDHYVIPPPVRHRGEVINAIRTFGETRIVVARDDGEIVEIPRSWVRLDEGKQ